MRYWDCGNIDCRACGSGNCPECGGRLYHGVCSRHGYPEDAVGLTRQEPDIDDLLDGSAAMRQILNRAAEWSGRPVEANGDEDQNLDDDDRLLIALLTGASA